MSRSACCRRSIARRWPSFERRLVRWWQQVSRSLGPASSTRAIADVAVVPLLQLLDHDRPAGVAGRCRPDRVAADRGVLLGSPGRSRRRTSWRCAVRLGLARRRRVGDRLQRPLAPHRRLHAIVDARGDRVRFRHAHHRTERHRGAVGAGARAARLDGARPRLAARPRRRIRRACVARLPIARRWRAVGPAAHSTTALAINPRGATDRDDRVRSGADARVSHPVPVVRRSAGARAGLERRLSRRLHDRRARTARFAPPPLRELRRTGSPGERLGNGPLERLPGDLAPCACGLQGRRSRSHRVQRPPVLAAAYAARRAAAVSDQVMRDVLLVARERESRRTAGAASRITTSASSSSDRSTSASSSTSRRSMARAIVLTRTSTSARPPAASTRRRR